MSVTLDPTAPVAGEKLEMVGTATTVNAAGLVAVPPAVVTLTEPVTAPGGTVAVIDVAETTVYDVAATPPNLTVLAPVRLEPAIETLAPAAPLVGEKVEIVGAGAMVNVPTVTLPVCVLTTTGPVVAPAGTVAVIDVQEPAVNAAAALLNVTDVTPTKDVPEMETDVPGEPLDGE